jgi:hypothetical protein
MQYILLIYGVEPTSQPSPADFQAEMDAYNAYTKFLQDRKAMVAGEALYPTTSATTVRVQNGKTTTTDGPFAETKEALGGYYVVNAKDLDEAIEFAAACPGAKRGAIEVRPLVDFSQPQ